MREKISEIQGIVPQFSRVRSVALISLLLLIGSVVPISVSAGVFSDFFAALKGTPKLVEASAQEKNLQTLDLVHPAMNIDPSGNRGGGDITIVDGSALVPEEGPSGTIADIERPKNATISRYVVRVGDTLGSVAKMFGVSPGTVLGANNLRSGTTLQVGQQLVILPITGMRYTVKQGDSIASIAKKFRADATEIETYNEIDNSTLAVGAEILIPNVEVSLPQPVRTAGRRINEPAHDVGPAGTSEQIGYYLRPIVGGTRTQGIHGYNAVDLAAPIGTPIIASAEGDVVIAKQGGWNGGYGSYVVIAHGNGSETLYGHMSSVITYDGEHVVQGQVIGYVGATGKATGPHVHFEIRNGIRNPF